MEAMLHLIQPSLKKTNHKDLLLVNFEREKKFTSIYIISTVPYMNELGYQHVCMCVCAFIPSVDYFVGHSCCVEANKQLDIKIK